MKYLLQVYRRPDSGVAVKADDSSDLGVAVFHALQALGALQDVPPEVRAMARRFVSDFERFANLKGPPLVFPGKEGSS